MDGNDAYEVLGVPPDASPDQVQRAWRRLAGAHHPDRVADPPAKAAAEERLRLVNAARDVLLNRRASYDAARRPPEPSDEEITEDPGDAPPDPWSTAAAGMPRPDPWASPSGVRHVHHSSAPAKRGLTRFEVRYLYFVAACWAIIIIAFVIAMS
ncbi:DnaJ domain-containing protein [Actinomadura sp. NAK00032]|nr:DnaJ domain-containing protein [Actinomadura sp. NAK00032]